MKPYDQMAYHPTTEKVVEILRAKTQRDDTLYFRLLTAFYFSVVASQMRASIRMPDTKGSRVPINMYLFNLAPSGFGKGKSQGVMEKEVLHLFRKIFEGSTYKLMAEQTLPVIANERAIRKDVDPDQELERARKELERQGAPLFTFGDATGPAVVQMRHALLMAGSGGVNLIMDEAGLNFSRNLECFTVLIELFDRGEIKTQLRKNTSESQRSEEILGSVPTNVMSFGTANALLDGGKTEEDFMAMLGTGYARRCFFGYVSNSSQVEMTPEQMFEMEFNANHDAELEALADRLANLADMINAYKPLDIKKETYVKLNAYRLDCNRRANKLKDTQEVEKREMEGRYFKALKLAGAYAFIDDAYEITDAHLEYAIKLAEDSGAAFTMMLARDKPYVKLAKYIAAVGEDITQADLAEDLPFYKGTISHKNDLMTMATAWGYKNNIIIKKSFSDGIEFLRGESLKEADLTKMPVSYSTDIATDYVNEFAPFNQLHKLTQAQGLHWVSHHLVGGHRQEENIIPGFSMVVVDVDGGASISTVKLLLKNYKFLLYTTKRHTSDTNRFRVILPINYELKLDAKDFKEFMANIFEWLPFEVDTATGQRARKWLSHDGHYEYNDGELLDALPFIPKTSKNEERKQLLNNQQSMDNLERWVMNNIGDGNRNNMLLRYALILVDGGFGYDTILQKILALNNKIAEKLDEAEILGTVMVTVGKTLAKR